MEQANQLAIIIEEQLLNFDKIAEGDWYYKPSKDKWSKKEILGHLIDSASNNLRRFIVSQYQPNDKIVYFQDEWVKYQSYQEMTFSDIVLLWKLINQQIVQVLNHIPTEKLQNTCDTGKEQVELRTLDFLATDYIVHLNHHLKQINS